MRVDAGGKAHGHGRPIGAYVCGTDSVNRTGTVGIVGGERKVMLARNSHQLQVREDGSEREDAYRCEDSKCIGADIPQICVPP